MPGTSEVVPDTYNRAQMTNTRRSVVVTGPANFFTGRTMKCRYSADLDDETNVAEFDATVSGTDDEICTVDVDLTEIEPAVYEWQLQDDGTPADRIWTGQLTVTRDLAH